MFWMKHTKSSELTLLVTAKYIPCILPSMEVDGKRDQSWQGQKYPCVPSRCDQIWTFVFTNWGENAFFQKEMDAGQSQGRGTLP
jgi:hypothetical protein